MHVHFWLASVAVAVCAVAGATALSPVLHGQAGGKDVVARELERTVARAEARAQEAAERRELVDVNRLLDQVHGASDQAGHAIDAAALASEIRAAVESAVAETRGAGSGDARRLAADMRRDVRLATRAAQDAMRDLDVDVLVGNALQSLTIVGGPVKLGIRPRDVTAEEAKAAGLPGITGAWVSDVSAESVAAQAGLQAGDIIVTVDGETIRSARQLSRVVNESPEGRALQIAYVRGTQRVTASVTPEGRRGITPGLDGRAFDFRGPEFRPAKPGQRFYFDGDSMSVRPRVWMSGRGRLGIGVQDLTPQLAEYFGVKEGVLITQVNEDSPAAKGGLKAGDVITSLNGKPVTETSDIVEGLAEVKGGTAVAVGVNRDRKAQSLSVTIEAQSTPSKGRTVIRKQRFTA